MHKKRTSLLKPSCGCSGFSKTSRPAQPRHNESGLTLIDVTVVLIIISLLLFPALKLMDINKQNLENTRLYGVTNDLALIVNDYALRNGAYPIPADPSLPISDPNVFKSLRHNPASYLPTANCSNNTSAGMTYYGVAVPVTQNKGVICRRQLASNGNVATQVYVGTLPVSTLGLPVEAGLDQYGNKFTYIVTRILTPTIAAERPLDDLANNNKGAIIVKNQNGTVLTVAPRLAHFAIITHGSNGAGAFKANGTIDSHTCQNPGTGNLDERNRWECRTGGSHTAGIVTDNIIVSDIKEKSSVNLGGNAATYFDDAIAYKTTALGKIWTPRQANEEYFTLGRRVGVGFTNADLVSPTEMLTIKGGNLKASGDAAIPKVCNDNNTNCFSPSDIGSANGPINCSQKAPLKKVTQVAKTNASGDCDDVKINTVMSTACQSTGIKTLTSLSGVLTCM